MYDQFPPIQRINFFPFKFTPTRYEIYRKAQKVELGETDKVIHGKINTNDSGKEFLSISIVKSVMDEDLIFKNVILTHFNFRLIITNNDRLLLAKIPGVSQDDSDSIAVLRSILGENSYEYLKQHEPFSCCLFLINRVIKKVTFTINTPETLIEFYDD